MENITKVKYELPDASLLSSDADSGFMAWIPSRTHLILGRSNDSVSSLVAENVDADGVIVMKRPSGGEAVLLSQNMVIVSVKIPKKPNWKSNDYFVFVNNLIKKVMQKFGVENLHSKGISDISIGNKKILGSAIYNTGNSMFYHAVINFSEDVNLISRYLKHPKKEPDYRAGRPHSQFVTSLSSEGYNIDKQDFIELIESEFREMERWNHVVLE